MHHSEFPACLLHALVVDEASVGAGAGDDEPGPEEPRRLLQLLVVNEARLGLEEEKRGRDGGRVKGQLWWGETFFFSKKENHTTHIQLVGHGLKVDGGGRDPLGVCHVAVGETGSKEEFRV